MVPATTNWLLGSEKYVTAVRWGRSTSPDLKKEVNFFADAI